MASEGGAAAGGEESTSFSASMASEGGAAAVGAAATPFSSLILDLMAMRMSMSIGPLTSDDIDRFVALEQRRTGAAGAVQFRRYLCRHGYAGRTTNIMVEYMAASRALKRTGRAPNGLKMCQTSHKQQ